MIGTEDTTRQFLLRKLIREVGISLEQIQEEGASTAENDAMGKSFLEKLDLLKKIKLLSEYREIFQYRNWRKDSVLGRRNAHWRK
jgi:hypothetical protein